MTVVASNYARKEHDLYQTEPWATDALEEALSLRHRPIWEPAAGNHLMADELLELGAMSVFTSDIETYDREHDERRDFFSYKAAPISGGGYLITNPPYGKGNHLAAKWARHALDIFPGLIALLLTAKFDAGKTRVDLFRDNTRFIGKITLLDRIQWFPGKHGGTEDHAWYIWAGSWHGHRHPHPTIHYASKEG